MEITENKPLVNFEAYTKNIKDKSKIDASAEPAQREILSEDKVRLSPKAKEIQEAKKLLNSVPDVREEKVAQIREQIENGTYQIEGEKIAVKMLKESLLNELP
ncbi:MAG: flagellar biosynthesis anti-sigma factor FlgM [Thermodesulfobacteriota bacterium]|nr:flagellar biosynthesis anti-sigma factor FlgM [Thermodesulfobacteriota bacterium]